MSETTVVTQELSANVKSAPVVMIFLNLGGPGLIPKWTRTVDEFEREPVMPGQSTSGRMLLQGRRIDLRFILDDLDRIGYIPLRLVDIRRTQGIKRRLVLVCVHKDHIKADDRRMPRREELDVRRLLQYLWDCRVYRNPGATGGNFIVEGGNPNSPSRKESPADLRIGETDESNEFELRDGERETE